MFNETPKNRSQQVDRYFLEHMNKDPEFNHSDSSEDDGRRYLLHEIPEDLEISRRSEIEQGYFFEEGLSTTLIKETNGATVSYLVLEERKGFRDRLLRQIPQNEFEELWEKTETNKITKTTLEIKDSTIEGEISKYHGNLEGLNVLSVNPVTADIIAFKRPTWVDREVSNSPEFDDSSLAISKPTLWQLLSKKTSTPVYFRKELDRQVEIPQYDLPDGFCELWRSISRAYTRLNIHSADKKILVVGVAGGSGSGKTTEVTNFLENKLHLKNVTISLDNYYRGKTWMEEQAKIGNEYNWDEPQALDLELLMEHLSALKRGEKIVVPEYDFTVSERKILSPEEEKQREIDPEKLDIIIVEGLFALNETLLGQIDFKTFVNASMETRLMRRMLRDIAERGRSPESVLSAFINTVEAMHQKYIQPTIENADIILNNKYNPKVESHNSGFHEIQQKYKTNLNKEELESMGVLFVKSEIQTDVYYNPSDKDPIKSGEILRLRTINEQGKKQGVFTYKGPKVRHANTSMRPYFECYVDDKTLHNFPKIFEKSKKTIEKRRDFFEYEGKNGIITFTLDEVHRVVDGNRIYMGTFLEVGKVLQEKRSVHRTSPFDPPFVEPYSQRDAKSLEVDELIEALGLGNDIPIIQSYFDME
jgi:uridine kinase